MNRTFFYYISTLLITCGFAISDDNHDTIAKVMKEGLKGDESPMARVLDRNADAEETKELLALVETLEGTAPPVGKHDAYNDKVGILIETLAKVAGGDTSDEALHALEEAQSCKACHSEHKPKKKQG